MTKSHQAPQPKRGLRLLAILAFLFLAIALFDVMGWLTEATGGIIVAISTAMTVNLYYSQPKNRDATKH